MELGGSWYCRAESRPFTFTTPLTGCTIGCGWVMGWYGLCMYGLFHVGVYGVYGILSPFGRWPSYHSHLLSL